MGKNFSFLKNSLMQINSKLSKLDLMITYTNQSDITIRPKKKKHCNVHNIKILNFHIFLVNSLTFSVNFGHQ